MFQLGRYHRAALLIDAQEGSPPTTAESLPHKGASPSIQAGLERLLTSSLVYTPTFSFTLITLGLMVSALGIVKVSTPCSKTASTLSVWIG